MVILVPVSRMRSSYGASPASSRPVSRITAEMLPGAAGGFAGMMLGVFFGGILEKYIPDQMFLKLIYILMAFSGLMMIF